MNAKHKKEMKSFRNKLDRHISWFNSLPTSKQYDILFLWKSHKYHKKHYPKPSMVRYDVYRVVSPVKLKHWIILIKMNKKFQSSRNRMRDSQIDLILKK